MTMSADRSTYVTAFGRGLEVIRCFSHAQPTLTIAEVARATGLNRATARRFLHTLQADGYITNENGRYTLRPAVMDLGHSYLSSMSIGPTFQRHLHDLAEEVREACSAGVLDGEDVVFLARAQTTAPRLMTLALSVGDRLPAYLTAIGRVLLAGLDDSRLDHYLATASFQAETEHTISDPELLKQELLRVREQGYAVLDQEIERSICAVAVRVRRPGQAPLAVSISTHSMQTPIETLHTAHLPVLQRTAAALEQCLADRPARRRRSAE